MMNSDTFDLGGCLLVEKMNSVFLSFFSIRTIGLFFCTVNREQFFFFFKINLGLNVNIWIV